MWSAIGGAHRSFSQTFEGVIFGGHADYVVPLPFQNLLPEYQVNGIVFEAKDQRLRRNVPQRVG
jgi:hypothetical protein